MKITLCTCNNAINLDFERIRKELEKRGILCKIESALCKNETSWNDGIIAACSKKYLPGSDFDIRKISMLMDLESATKNVIALLSSLPEPREKTDISNKNSAVVIGGGFAGVHCALELSNLGVETTLVEKNPVLYGIACKIGFVFPSDDCSLCVGHDDGGWASRRCIYRKTFNNENLKILNNSEVVNVDGAAGNFKVTIKRKKTRFNENCTMCGKCIDRCENIIVDQLSYPLTPVVTENCEYCKKCMDWCEFDAINFDENEENIKVDAGAVIVAAGGEAEKTQRSKPEKNIITQLDLAVMLRDDNFDNVKNKNVVMIQCMDLRNEKANKYCSGICCLYALKHAIEIKKRFPDVEVAICYIDIRSTGFNERYYDEARELGVNFMKGITTPEEWDDFNKNLFVEDQLSGELIDLKPDMLVLSTGFSQDEKSNELAKILGIDVNEHGFVESPHGKIGSNLTTRKGIFACGISCEPKDIQATINQAKACSIDVLKFLNQIDAVGAEIDLDKCVMCGKCAEVCPRNAVNFYEEKDFIEINKAGCDNCGTCASFCPEFAINANPKIDFEMLFENEGIDRNSTAILYCVECAGAGLERLSYTGEKIPPDYYLFPCSCAAAVSIIDILRLLKNFDKVMIVGCPEKHCRNGKGNDTARDRVLFIKELLREIGISGNRVDYTYLSSYRTKEFIDKVVKNEPPKIAA
ncbi:MAG: hypothetical protein A7315_05475 [Candidatus Altiarchaeales archaeon WOR_SM1_79]|nr:MAG: hypothetical protein A7315_05475 [Candidatus Altiarchaeales archaeon WOR_SM1_79]